jgi:hypothetical protein
MFFCAHFSEEFGGSEKMTEREIDSLLPRTVRAPLDSKRFCTIDGGSALISLDFDFPRLYFP